MYYYKTYFDNFVNNLNNSNYFQETGKSDIYNAFNSGSFWTLNVNFALPYEIQKRAESVTDAYLYITENPLNPDTNALISKHITPSITEVAGIGYLNSIFNLNSYADMWFILTDSDTLLMQGTKTYYYRIDYLTSAGKTYNYMSGTIMAGFGHGSNNPAVVALTELELVRDKTTSDTTKLGDTKILQYLLEYLQHPHRVRVLLAAADCLEMLDRGNLWETKSQGQLSISGSQLKAKAKEYRQQANGVFPRLF